MKKGFDNSHGYSSLLSEIIKGRLTEIIVLTRRRVEKEIANNNTVRPNVLAEGPWGPQHQGQLLGSGRYG